MDEKTTPKSQLLTAQRVTDFDFVPNGSQWFPFVPNGSEWFRLVPFGSVWFRLVPFGSVSIPALSLRSSAGVSFLCHWVGLVVGGF